MDGATEVDGQEPRPDNADRSKEVQRWADAHQYRAEPQPTAARRGPVVTLLNATPDPLGSLAALTAIYEGRVVRSLAEVTDEQRRAALVAMQSTELSGPLEVAQFHFLVEGVNRAWTHQAVRGRNAFYAQESLRFAVVEDWSDGVPLPPSLAGLGEDHVLSRLYRKGLISAEDTYGALVANGMPAEEARDLLPHAVQTRLHWVCDLRELLHVAGLRTCTQAQFVWRQVMAGVAQTLRGWHGSEYYHTSPGLGYASQSDRWQFEAIADALRPVCYQTGRCGFMARFDRSCTIRERVEAFAENGIPSSEWGRPFGAVRHRTDERGKVGELYTIEPIHDYEWAADPGAARKKEV